MSHKRSRKKRRKANLPTPTHVIEHSPDTHPDPAAALLSEETGLAEDDSAEKQTADKRAAKKNTDEEAVPFIPKEKSVFSPGRLIRPALTIAGAAVCLLVIMYFNARMAGSYPGERIISSLRGKNTETYSSAPEESPSFENTVKEPDTETEAESQTAVIMSENAAVEKTDDSASNTSETAEAAEEESEEEYEEEEYYEEEYEEEEYYEYEYEDEDEEYEYEEEYEDEDEDEYGYLEGEVVDDFD